MDGQTGEVARVLTLEELRKRGKEGVVDWLECDFMMDACRFRERCTVFRMPYTELAVLDKGNAVKMPDGLYGSGWRVWDRKPTEEDRKRTPWEKMKSGNADR